MPALFSHSTILRLILIQFLMARLYAGGSSAFIEFGDRVNAMGDRQIKILREKQSIVLISSTVCACDIYIFVAVGYHENIYSLPTQVVSLDSSAI